MKRIIFLMLLLSQFASCSSRQQTPASLLNAEKGQAPGIGIRTAELEGYIHSLINKERKKHGLSPLASNDALSRIARKHSEDMAKRNYFSHYSPEGRDFSYRYREEGYSCAFQVSNRVYGGAENIFQNNLFDRMIIVNGVAHYEWNSMQKIAETTVQGWMKSPGHRKNILTPHWKSEGIGAAFSADDKIYITENFC